MCILTPREHLFSAEELTWRFALHILPSGFMRIRYYGFLANAVRAKKLKVIRKALSVADEHIEADLETLVVGMKICPQCGKSNWHFVGVTVRLHWQPG